MTDIIVDNRLIINKLTKAEYDALEEKSDTELYLIPDIVDSTPTQNSENYVTSGGVYTALAAKANAADMKFTNGTGANADKVTIQLKSGTTSAVLRTHQDISGKEDVTTIEAPVNATDATQPLTSLTCAINKYYRIDVPIETISITLPAMTNVTTAKTITLFLTGGTAPDPQFASATTGVNVYFADGFQIESGETYEVSCLWNGMAWIVAAIKIIISS